MLLVGTRSLERWTERIFVFAAAKRPSTALRATYHRQKLLGIRQLKTSISHEGGLQTQIKAAKGLVALAVQFQFFANLDKAHF